MSDTEEAPKKNSKLPLLIGLVLAIAGGGSGYFAVNSGMLFGSDVEHAEPEIEELAIDIPDVAFIPIEPMVISLSDASGPKHLRFRAQLEVESTKKAEVEKLLPRVVDVLNSYLRAVKSEDLANQSALVRLRGQMLRRIQIVTGEGRVNDLLIMEFVLN